MGKKDPLVKDTLTGELKPRSTLWKAPNHRYYTSEEAYNEMVAKKAAQEAAEEKRKWRRNVIIKATRKEMYDLCGIPFTEAPPGILLKREKELRDAYGEEVVYEAVIRCKKEIARALEYKQHDLRDLVSAGLYAFGVLRSKLPDVAVELEREKQIRREQAKNQRQAEIIDINSFVGRKPKSRDLSELF